MEKIFIEAKLYQKGGFFKSLTNMPLPATKKEIENVLKSFEIYNLNDCHIEFVTNLPEEFTNFIEYKCFITENNGYSTINTGQKYTSYDRLKFYNTLALCLDDMYNSDNSEDLITRYISAYAEHAAIILKHEEFEYFLEDDDYDDETDEEYNNLSDKKTAYTHNIVSVALLTKATANFLNGYYGFLDYSEIDGDFYVLGAWDIDEYEGETIDDYDDDPVAYLEALTECYELYVNEEERYILDIYHASKEAEETYNKKLEDKLIELGY